MKSELLKRIIKNSPTKNTSILSESVMFQKKDVIPTDVPIINVAFSGDVDGGLSSGLTIFAGPSRNFKSMLALICVKAFLDKYDDGICILYDSEGGITPEYLKTLNIDPTRVVHIPIEHIEMLKFDLVKQLNEITREDKVIILIDSIGNAASLKELEDALSEKSVAEMQRAKSIKGLFRMVTPSLLIKDVPCIAVSHSYSELSLYPKQIISGGCLVEGTKIILADGSTKNIESCNCGDLVMTLSGHKEITHIWNADNLEESEPECFSIEFEDGYIVECSYNHKFLIDNKWVYTKDIHIGNDVTNINKVNNSCKVVNITPIGKKKVYDIAVDEVEHYILENGVVSHNSGLLYSCNQAFIIGKSQEKEGSDLVGYNFIINIEKSRYVKEKSKFPFTVTFDGGIQKYSGLMDIAIDGGFVVKPSQGWYAKVNKTTGEIGEKMRLSKTQTDEFWQPILQNKEFKEYVKQKYEIAHGAIMEHCSLVEEEEIND